MNRLRTVEQKLKQHPLFIASIADSTNADRAAIVIG
jgi:hypothetical protein